MSDEEREYMEDYMIGVRNGALIGLSCFLLGLLALIALVVR